MNALAFLLQSINPLLCCCKKMEHEKEDELKNANAHEKEYEFKNANAIARIQAMLKENNEAEVAIFFGRCVTKDYEDHVPIEKNVIWVSSDLRDYKVRVCEQPPLHLQGDFRKDDFLSMVKSIGIAKIVFDHNTIKFAKDRDVIRWFARVLKPSGKLVFPCISSSNQPYLSFYKGEGKDYYNINGCVTKEFTKQASDLTKEWVENRQKLAPFEREIVLEVEAS